MVFSHELFLPWMLITKFFPKPRNNQYVTFQIIPNVSSSFDPQKVSLSKNIVFLQIVSAETMLFWKWKMWKFLYSFRILWQFFLHKSNSCCGNYWTIQGRKLFTKESIFQKQNYVNQLFRETIHSTETLILDLLLLCL